MNATATITRKSKINEETFNRHFAELVTPKQLEILNAEFVDLYNDLRVATVREIIDLLDLDHTKESAKAARETAESVLYYAQRFHRLMFPGAVQHIDMVDGPVPADEEEEIPSDPFSDAAAAIAAEDDTEGYAPLVDEPEEEPKPTEELELTHDEDAEAEDDA